MFASLGGVLAVLLCAVGVATADTIVGGTISADTTWSFVNSPYIVTSSITVVGSSGADGVTTLTIEPGVEVRFDQNRRMTVGGTSSSSKGALVALGTEASPITFTSNLADPGPGSWWSVFFYNYANDGLSAMENVTIEYAGSTAALYLNRAEPRLRNLTISDSSTYGIRIDYDSPTIMDSTIEASAQSGIYIPYGGSPEIVSTTLRDNGGYGLYTTKGSPTVRDSTFDNNTDRPMRVHVESILERNTYADNGIDEILLMANPSSLMQKDRTLPAAFNDSSGDVLPYVVQDSFTVRGKDGADDVTTWTIEAGAELRFNSGRTLTVAGTSSAYPGALVTLGTADDPVVFTSNQETKTRGYWAGVVFNNYADDALSVMDNLTIEYGGSTANLYLVNAAPTLHGCTLREASGSGVRINTADPVFNDCVIQSNGAHGVYVPSGGEPEFHNSNISFNGNYGMYVANGVPVLNGNAFTENTNYAARVHVESTFGDETFAGNGEPGVELMATPGTYLTKDRSLPKFVDEGSGDVVPFRLTASLTVRGTDGGDGVTTLTLEEGAELQLGYRMFLDIGTNSASAPGAFVAAGTMDDPAVITSTQATPTRGYWGGLRFYDHASDAVSSVENLTLSFGGYGGQMVYVYKATPKLQDLVAEESSDRGVYLDDTTAELVGSTVRNNTGHGVYVRTGNAVVRDCTLQENGGNGIYTESGVPTVTDSAFIENEGRAMRVDIRSDLAGNTFRGNTLSQIELRFASSTLQEDRRLAYFADEGTGEPVAYVFTGDLTLSATGGLRTLTIEPGVEVRMRSGVQLTVGSSTAANRGALVARGTEDRPIRFTSDQAAGSKTSGYWKSVYFHDSTDEATSALANVTIESGGLQSWGTTASLWLYRAAPTLVNVTVDRSLQWGIRMDNAQGTFRDLTVVNGGGSNSAYGLEVVSPQGATPTVIDGLHVKDYNGRPLRMAPDSDVRDVTVENVGSEFVNVYARTLVKDVTWPVVTDVRDGHAIPLLVAGTITVIGDDGADDVTTLTVQPGTVVALSGTSTRLIVASSSTYTNPNQGALSARGTAEAPIVFTSAAATKNPGDWGRIEVYDFADDGLTAFENVTVEYGDGYWSSGALYIYKAAPHIADLTVRYNDNYGLYLAGSPLTIRGGVFEANGDDGFGWGLYYDRAGVWPRPTERLRLHNVAFRDEAGRPARVTPDALLENVTFTGLDVPELELSADDIRYDTRYDVLLDAADGTQVTRVFAGWSRVNGDDGADGLTTLTLDPGVEVRFVSGSLEVGEYDDEGALDARGTAEAPILFTSAEAPADRERGDWYGLEFGRGTAEDASFVENVTIEFARWGLYLWEAAPRINNVEIRDSRSMGVYVDEVPARIENSRIVGTGLESYDSYGLYVWSGYEPEGRVELVNVTIEDTYGYPVSIAADTLLEDMTFRNNSEQFISLDYTIASEDAHWSIYHAADTGDVVPYHIYDYAIVAGDDGPDGVTTLTIDPGVEVRLDQWAGMGFGDYWDERPGALHAVGTVDTPVVFTSHEPDGQLTRGYWGAIEFYGNAAPASSRIENATFMGGGGWSNGAVYLWDATPVFRNNLIQTSESYGLYVESGGPTIEATRIVDTEGFHAYGFYGEYTADGTHLVDVTVEDTQGHALYMAPGTTLDGVRVVNATRNAVFVAGGVMERDATWRPLVDEADGAALPFIVDWSIHVRGDDGADGVTTLTLDPRVEARFLNDAALVVGVDDAATPGGALVADATLFDRIVLTSAEPEGVRSPAYWGGVRFLDGSVDGASVLRNVTVAHGGSTGEGGLYVHAAQPVLRDVVVEYGGEAALYGHDLTPGFRLDGVVLRRSDVGMILDDSEAPFVTGSRVSGENGAARINAVANGTFESNWFGAWDGAFVTTSNATGNLIVDNVFIRDAGGSPVLDDGAANEWSRLPYLSPNIIGGPFVGGNYYSDYDGFDISSPSDGIGDTGLPYPIPGAAGVTDLSPIVTQDRWKVVEGAPKASADIVGNLTAIGWYDGPITVTLSAVDEEGDAFTLHYSLDGQPFQPYTGTLTIDADGRHAFYYYAIDEHGNAAALEYTAFRIDGTPPVVLADPRTTQPDDFCFVIYGQDAHVGLETLTWTVRHASGDAVVNKHGELLEGIAVRPGGYVCAGLDRDGDYTLIANAADRIGHASEHVVTPLNVDVAAPTFTWRGFNQGHALAHTAAVPLAPELGYGNASIVVVHANASVLVQDLGVGVDTVAVLVDGAPVNFTLRDPRPTVAQAVVADFEVGAEHAAGWHTLTVVATDLLGHERVEERLFQLVKEPTPEALLADVDAALAPTVDDARAALATVRPKERLDEAQEPPAPKTTISETRDTVRPKGILNDTRAGLAPKGRLAEARTFLDPVGRFDEARTSVTPRERFAEAYALARPFNRVDEVAAVAAVDDRVAHGERVSALLAAGAERRAQEAVVLAADTAAPVVAGALAELAPVEAAVAAAIRETEPAQAAVADALRETEVVQAAVADALRATEPVQAAVADGLQQLAPVEAAVAEATAAVDENARGVAAVVADAAAAAEAAVAENVTAAAATADAAAAAAEAEAAAAVAAAHAAIAEAFAALAPEERLADLVGALPPPETLLGLLDPGEVP